LQQSITSLQHSAAALQQEPTTDAKTPASAAKAAVDANEISAATIIIFFILLHFSADKHSDLARLAGAVLKPAAP
jgi:hypothetical protein